MHNSSSALCRFGYQATAEFNFGHGMAGWQRVPGSNVQRTFCQSTDVGQVPNSDIATASARPPKVM
jgi:hypothetical protein